MRVIAKLRSLVLMLVVVPSVAFAQAVIAGAVKDASGALSGRMVKFSAEFTF